MYINEQASLPVYIIRHTVPERFDGSFSMMIYTKNVPE